VEDDGDSENDKLKPQQTPKKKKRKKKRGGGGGGGLTCIGNLVA